MAIWTAQNAPAQTSPDSAVTTTIPTGTPGAPMLLSFGSEEILQLAQAGVDADKLRAFVRSSHLDYDLGAAGIVYLRQHGVPDAVVYAMLQQTKHTIDEAEEAVARQDQAAEAAAFARQAAYYWQTYGLQTLEPLPDYSYWYPVYEDTPIPYDYYDHDYDRNPDPYYSPYPSGYSLFSGSAGRAGGFDRRESGYGDGYNIGNQGFGIGIGIRGGWSGNQGGGFRGGHHR